MEVESSETAGAWRERIEKQTGSGQSIRAWCLANGLHEHAFYWWRSRLGLSPRPARVRRRKHKAVFAEVVIDQTNASKVAMGQAVREASVEPASIVEPIVLRLLGGREFVLPVSMSDRRLAALIGLIEGRPSSYGRWVSARCSPMVRLPKTRIIPTILTGTLFAICGIWRAVILCGS